MARKIRGFEVLEGSKSRVLEIMKNDSDCEKNYGNEAEMVDSENWIPQRSTEGSAGYDLRSTENMIINPMECKLIHTGLTVYMQVDEELQVRTRSGGAYKKQVIVLNAPGTVDFDYYGQEVGVIMMNFGQEPFEVKAGDRVAQGIFNTVLFTDDDEPRSKFRTGGFGSTGTR